MSKGHNSDAPGVPGLLRSFDFGAHRAYCDAFRVERGRATLADEIAAGAEVKPDAEGGQLPLAFRLTGSQKKTAFALRYNIDRMIAGNSPRELFELETSDGKKLKAWRATRPENLNCTGFLTLTVGDYECEEHGRQLPDREHDKRPLCPCCGRWMRFVQVFDNAEASRRFNNLNRRLLPLVFEKVVIVPERHGNGAIHFHGVGLVTGRPDIRSTFNFEAFMAARAARAEGTIDEVAETEYKTAACEELRRLWALLREHLPAYGFGRAELTPIRKTGEAVSSYIAKYVEKNLFSRRADDKGAKLVRYIGWDKTQLKPNDFSWATPGACKWRRSVRALAGLVGVSEREEMKETFGDKWAFEFSRIIAAVDQPGEVASWPFKLRRVARDEIVRLNERWCRDYETNAENWAAHKNDFAEMLDASEAEGLRGVRCSLMPDTSLPRRRRRLALPAFEMDGQAVVRVERLTKRDCGASGWCRVTLDTGAVHVVKAEEFLPGKHFWRFAH